MGNCDKMDRDSNGWGWVECGSAGVIIGGMLQVLSSMFWKEEQGKGITYDFPDLQVVLAY